MDNCIFCKIIAGDIPSMRVYEDEVCVAILDINPAAPGHTLILPKKHYQDLFEMDEETAGKLLMVAQEIGKRQMERLGAQGVNLVQNNGAAAGQTVLHFHLHVIPRFENDGSMVLWNPTEPSMDDLKAICEKLA